MTRRAALLTLLSIPLAKFDAYAVEAGWLTIDLGQWKGMTVKHGVGTVTLTGTDIMNALLTKKGN